MFPTGKLVDDLDVPGVGTLQGHDDQRGHPDDLRQRRCDRLHRHRAAGRHQRRCQGTGDVRDHSRARRHAHGIDQAASAEAAQRQHTPKLAFVAKPADYTASSGKRVAAADIDLLVRALSMGKLHHAMMGTAAVAIGTAAAIPGTLVNLAAGGGARTGGALRSSLRHLARRRGSDLQGRRMDRDAGHHEPQRARVDGRLGARSWQCALSRHCTA